MGAKRARSLIERHGTAGVLGAIDRDPAGALAAVGLRREPANAAAASWEALRVMRQLHLLLAPHGLGYLATRIHLEYGAGAHRVVRENSYELTSVFGVGFLTADRIARAMGAAADSPERARAGALYLLSEAERSGSTCMPLTVLLSSLRELIGAERSEAFIDQLVTAGDLVREEHWIYRRQTAELEAELAQRVAEMVRGPAGGRLRKPRDIAAASGPEPTAEQLAGVRNAFTRRLSLITGGPGNWQDRLDQDDRIARRRPGYTRDAGRADRSRSDPDDRDKRHRRTHGALRPRVDPRAWADPRRGRPAPRRPPDRR